MLHFSGDYTAEEDDGMQNQENTIKKMILHIVLGREFLFVRGDLVIEVGSWDIFCSALPPRSLTFPARAYVTLSLGVVSTHGTAGWEVHLGVWREGW